MKWMKTIKDVIGYILLLLSIMSLAYYVFMAAADGHIDDKEKEQIIKSVKNLS